MHGREVLEAEQALLELPTKLGGLALADPMKSASSSFSISKEVTSVLQEAVQSGGKVAMAEHAAHCRAVMSNTVKWKEDAQLQLSSHLLEELPALQRCTLHHIMKGGASGWLTVLPLCEEDYNLLDTQFYDQLAIRCHHEPIGLPAQCDGCGAPFSLQHGLDCPDGGLVKRGRNNLHDSEARLADVAWGGISVEPILVTENGK